MTSSTLLATREPIFGSYAQTITPFWIDGVIEQPPRMRPRLLRNKVRLANSDSNVTVLFSPNETYAILDDGNDLQDGFLGTIEQEVIASREWVLFYMDLKSKSPNPDLEEKFANLAKQWYQDTAFHSSISNMQEHPAYKEILFMGEEAIPFIFRELEKGLGYWFPALKSITNHDPIDSRDRGRVKKMTLSWLQWGKEHGYTW